MCYITEKNFNLFTFAVQSYANRCYHVLSHSTVRSGPTSATFALLEDMLAHNTTRRFLRFVRKCPNSGSPRLRSRLVTLDHSQFGGVKLNPSPTNTTVLTSPRLHASRAQRLLLLVPNATV